jgi:hypothetical protein
VNAEGWRYERAIPTVDVAGEPTRVVVGLVEQGDRLTAALRVDDGKAALVPLENGRRAVEGAAGDAGELVASRRPPRPNTGTSGGPLKPDPEPWGSS